MTFAFCRQETPQEDAEEEAPEASQEDPLGAQAEIGIPAAVASCLHV
jgi:hypothetical protein